jgi:hypothetical protein
MNAISLPDPSSEGSPSSEDTVTKVAIILKHIETGFYVILTYLVYRV